MARYGLSVALVLSLLGCLFGAPANYPKECEVRCTTDDYNLPPTGFGCMSESPTKCGTSLGSKVPQCEDGSKLTVAMCQDNGHMKCNDGREPLCVAPPPDAGDAADAASDASNG